jgi:glycosyltransferase involved in cell wall biosynthesis
MDVTVCICTHDRAGYLSDCLEGLRRQTVGDNQFDILVVDSASNGDVPAQLVRLVCNHRNARLLRVEQAGLSVARNAGAWEADGDYIAYIDDDAIAAPDWIECILGAIREADPPPALIGGRILPHWEAPLPFWWPLSLRGSLSIIEAEGRGEYRTAALPPGLEPYGANMVVHVPSLRAIGGFGRHSGRIGAALLSDEEVQLAWKLQDSGLSARYDSRIVARHQIQAARLTPAWLLSRLYWQGVSTVRTRQLLDRPGDVWHELPRRIAVAALFAPSALLPRHSTRLVPCRWRFAYALGFIRAAFGWDGVALSARPGGRWTCSFTTDRRKRGTSATS